MIKKKSSLPILLVIPDFQGKGTSGKRPGQQLCSLSASLKVLSLFGHGAWFSGSISEARCFAGAGNGDWSIFPGVCRLQGTICLRLMRAGADSVTAELIQGAQWCQHSLLTAWLGPGEAGSALARGIQMDLMAPAKGCWLHGWQPNIW